ncbi:MAG: Cna B-type domain-containing protein, partial [Tissierellaceae bacterium]
TNRQVVDITATKIWDGGKYNRPGEDIYFQLYRTDYTGGDEVKEPVKLETEDENGKVVVIWENLEATDEDGKEYTYYVKEVLKGEDDTFTEISDANPLANYKVSYGKTEGEYSLEVTNTYIIPTDGEVTAIKNWEGGDAGNRPEIWFKLYRQVETEPSEPVPEAEVKQPTNENNWEVTWINLEKTDIDGNTYTFSVKEGYYDDGDKWIEIDHDNTLQNYTVTYDGLEVTNTYESPRINVKVTKNWINGENHRPSSIEVELYRSTDEDAENPTQLTEKTISLSNSEGWTHTWTELEETDYDGKKYYYSVKEVPLDNYNSKVTGDMEDGFTITNTYVIPSDGEVTANKVWKGGELPRPTIWFKLFRQVGEGQAEPAKVLDGSERAEIKELADETIEVTWTDLEERDEQGNKYTFSVREVNEDGTDLDWMPEGYYKDEEELTVTNTKEGTIWVDVKKVWENVETPGPEVTIKLYSQKESETEPQDTGKEIKLNTVNSWEGSFDGLDQYDTEGKPITYTVKEAEVPEGYTERYDNNGNRWTITNTKTAITPEKMTIEAIKEWAGGSVGKPDIWFKLLRESYFHTELTQAGDIKQVPSTTSGAAITVTWDNMDKTDEYGNEYTYFVREVDKDGKDYTPANYVKTENELKVTNHYVSPQDASAKATKEWIYGPSERPTTWFKLYRKVEGGDLEQVPDADIIILPNGTTEVIWTGLTKTDSNGKEYSFSVKEVDHDGNDYTPENYEKSEDGLTITNTYVIPKTNITATKVWSGGSSNKPTIELQLYRQLEGEDKEAVGDSVELKDGETEHTWEDLDATDEDGNEYTYTVDEVSVPTRYRKSISVDGLTITNTYSPPYTPPSGGGGTPPPKEEEPEEPTEPEQPEEPEEPEEPEKPTEPEKPDEPKKPFSFLIFEDPEEDPEGDPEDGPIVKQIIETPVIFREPGDEDNPSNRIRYNPKTKRIEVDDLEDDEEVEVIVTTTIEDEEIVVGKLKIRKGKDGEPVIEEELIDPYGTIRDSETNDPVGDVELKIYFADTPRNRENGRTPGTLVNLPVVPGFTPNDNRNPQISVHELVWSDETGDHGNYAWLVFPKTDYYIVAKRTGYEDYTSPTISVEYDIIKHDITMLSTDGDGTLPKTGEGSHLPFYIIGLVMIVLGYMTRKRKIA